MPKIRIIFEQKHILPYLEARGLVKQYIKARRFLLMGNMAAIFFKERNPKNFGVWQFRINKQFRALGAFDTNGRLTIFEIDNHQ